MSREGHGGLVGRKILIFLSVAVLNVKAFTGANRLGRLTLGL